MQLYDMGDLAESRRDAEEGLTDRCVVTRGTGKPVYNPVTRKYESAGDTVYPTPEQVAGGNPGKCRMQSGRVQVTDAEAAGAVFTVERLELQLPFGTVFEQGDVVTYVEAPFNPALVGNTYRITGLGAKSQATLQRFTVEVLT
ncbi:DUF6093 family protein [Arthrobacter agilis]|uniref:DUF6093 family protein n=1 Tax=Arthrobacter agilis TaxID=37921 RepID=UPI0023659B18|nr:DUF6093 family protein [Arthrobacter agilis]WDF32247.1 DUF6093 family protein [Arthrobacter agilis]